MKRFRNALIVQVCAGGEQRLCGEAQNSIATIANGGLVVSEQGLIVAVGTEAEIERQFKDQTFAETIDCTNQCLLPGFIDGHTHPVWAGDRVHEFKLKLAGATYMDIHKAGGGIGFTVQHTTAASEEELERSLLQRLDRMLAFGTTTAEAKTGYGLTLEPELKMLRVLSRDAVRRHAVELSVTYLAAHSVPAGSTAAAAARDIADVHLPRVAALRDGGVACENVDVFLEKGVFELDDTRRILQAGAAHGLRLNFHGDELHPMASGALAEELQASAVSHLECIDDDGIAAMARAGSVAVLLPTTVYVLRLEPPPARALLTAGVAVALGTDYNPNAHCLSMPHTMNLACVLLRLTCNEALAAATINAAASIGRAQSHGSLEVGKQADLVLLDAPQWEHVIYQQCDPPIARVYKAGRCVFARATPNNK